MNKYKRLIVYGCSLTKDNYIDTWADLLSINLGLPLINCAERGAGYNYILQKVLSTEFLLSLLGWSCQEAGPSAHLISGYLYGYLC